jgi:hypothetical protein
MEEREKREKILIDNKVETAKKEDTEGKGEKKAYFLFLLIDLQIWFQNRSPVYYW